MLCHGAQSMKADLISSSPYPPYVSYPQKLLSPHCHAPTASEFTFMPTRVDAKLHVSACGFASDNTLFCSHAG